MNAHAEAAATHPETPTRTFVWIWVWLVAITGIEVLLGYLELQPHLMLTLLVGLSVIKAALIMSYFMHLKFEKFSLVLWIVPATIFCILMMIIFFFQDSLRLLHFRVH